MCLVDYMVIKADLKSKGYKFLLSYHDELNTECTPEIADKVGAILKKGIQMAGKRLKLACPMDGDYKIGHNWAEVH